jgi:hypothetical protein
MHYFQQVFEILKQASSMGEEHTDAGVTLLGKVRHVGPDAWLHILFPPLESSEINLLEEEIGKSFPDAIREFLELSNGLNAFSDSLAIFGRRGSFNRTLPTIEPYSITSMNLYERPPNLANRMLLVGSYSLGNGSFLYIDPKSGAVYRCSRSDATPSQRWDDFGEMLYAEVSRLSRLFDDRGMLRDPEASAIRHQ